MKPQKPYPKFELTANGNGQWSKKIKGKVYYYGVWAEPMKALERYYKSKQYHENGVRPPADCRTVAELIDQFLADKDSAVENGELEAATRDGYKSVTNIIRDKMGNRELSTLIYPDFKRLRSWLSDGQKVTTLNRKLTVARMLFKFAEKMGEPIRYDGLESPNEKLLRRARNEAGEKLFTAEQIRSMVANGNGIAAMVLLGINCGYGPADCLRVEGRWVQGNWINYPRPKTEVKRRCWLWPETKAALPETKGLLFPGWDRHSLKAEFNELQKDFRVMGSGMYTLRRTLETIAVTADVPQAIIDTMMGHTDRSMGAVYRQKVFDRQLQKCSEHVRGWYRGEIELD